jgi:acetoin utilization deacetylase AcuC-like enzyme
VAGFCYFNNMAAACEALLSRGDASRVAIVDVDVHHGDGTEEILHGRDGLLFCSLHQSPLYPGTGLKSRGNCLNVTLPPGTGEKDYLLALEGLLRSVEDFKPEVLAVSAGFDTYKECPIAELRLERRSYRRMGKLLAEACPRRFALLEGGYAPELPLLVESFLEAFFP